MFMFCTLTLIVATIPGNIFYNGIIIGVAMVICMLFCNWLLNTVGDMTALYLSYGTVVFALCLFILFPGNGNVAYIANLITALGAEVWFVALLLIMELRVPPQHLGSVSSITRTFAVGTSVLSPIVASMEQPWPFYVILMSCTFAIGWSCGLPKPGQFLVKTVQPGEDGSRFIDKSIDNRVHFSSVSY
jgi:MFS family permease